MATCDMPSAYAGEAMPPENKLPQSAESPVLVFADVDNTLVKGATIFMFAMEAWKSGYIKWRHVIPALFHQRAFIKKGESPQRITSTRERAQALVAGHSVAEFDRIAEVAWRRSIAPKVFPNVLKQLRHHQELGHQVWLLTASPQGLASVMARDLRLSGAFGTTLMEHDGRFTGEINGELLHGPLKEQQALAFAASVGANLKDCYAYSDSIADIPLLTVVGHPVAVNPDASLLKHATHHSWPILWPEGSKRHQASRSKRAEKSAGHD
jgi:HAD superfamily hydrolase (TIGR01490 family)